MLFFVLSGFLVGGMSLERYLHGKFEFKKYIIDRISRIYTPFVPAVFFYSRYMSLDSHAIFMDRSDPQSLVLQGIFAEPVICEHDTTAGLYGYEFGFTFCVVLF